MLRGRLLRFCALPLVLAIHPAAATAQPAAREPVPIQRDHRGKPISVPATLMVPPGTGKVPAMIVVHGSGGVSESREYRYAGELVAMGVAALVIDSFTPRGIKATVQDQSQVSSSEMTDDALAALKILAAHPRIASDRIGIVGFSKGGSVALEALVERRAARVLPQGPRFALHVPVYPSCASQYLVSRPTNAPVVMLLGGSDTYVGVAPCTDYADKLKAKGVAIEAKVYPGAKHGFDGERDYADPKGENWSRCIFDEQADGSWKERTSGAVTFAQGRPQPDGLRTAKAACVKLGIEGGPNAAARAAALIDIKAAVRKHLIERK